MNNLLNILVAFVFALAMTILPQKAHADVEFEEFEEEEFFEDEFIEEDFEEMMMDDDEMMMDDEFVEDEEEPLEPMMEPIEETNTCTLDTSTRLGIICDLWTAEFFGEASTDAFYLSQDRQDGFNPRNSAATVNSGVFGITGRILTDFNYVLLYDFLARTPDGGGGQFEDAYISYTFQPNWEVRVGNISTAYNLEQATDSRFENFMETTYIDNAYGETKPRYPALTLFYGGEWTSAHFGTHLQAYNADEVGSGGSDVAVFGRFTFAPHSEEEDGYYSHFGLGGQYYNYNEGGRITDNANLSLSRIRGTAPFSTGIVNPANAQEILFDTSSRTPAIFGSRYIMSIDTAFGKRPWGVQAGATRIAQEPRAVGDTVDYYHFYGQFNWWFTQERNRYDPSSGIFERIVPISQINQGGLGALGFAARYHRLLLANDEEPVSGQVWGFTAGLTWKPNPYIKFFAEYIYISRDAKACAASSAGTGSTPQQCTGGGDAPRGVQFRALVDF